MPHVVISCFKADIPRSNLERLQQEITVLLQRELSCIEQAVSIDLQQIDPIQWNELVYCRQILPRMNNLLRKPNYNY